ncbi:hypothetical protein KSD_70470 [Ktedonobacter sp. SOSP1-85]|uniref:hypothetical protein n=1 Tax=Ktedonobacter sp. SOSP1-85 TaxID=2778367 RepID=UPI0019161040|nr:hypothetical protein [Ktedonobacter sp. SOSP1-85]GHO79276.1 hypothetical protein KSD_70470 [Ktedonobacter sp. SOSP1-85]
MPAHIPGNEFPEHTSAAMHLEHKDEEKHVGVIGNERLTALVSLVLLVLIIVELVTSAFLRIWLPAHTVVGVLLVGPLLVKMGSTGWRFLRYYTRTPAYVRRGPPPLVLRVLGPMLLVTTLVMVGSGIGLVVTGPTQPFLLAHVFSALPWLPLMAVHSLAHLQQVKRRLADDWSTQQGPRSQIGRGLRLGVNLGVLLLGVIGAWLLFPAAIPLFAWSQANVIGVGPFLVGMGAALLVGLITQPWKMEKVG